MLCYSTMHMVRVYNLIIVLCGLIQVILLVMAMVVSVVFSIKIKYLVIQTILIYILLVMFHQQQHLHIQVIIKEV